MMTLKKTIPGKEHIGVWLLFVAVLIYLPKSQYFDACHFTWERTLTVESYVDFFGMV
jgi:hypothetical protein